MMLQETRHGFPAKAVVAKARRGWTQACQAWDPFFRALLKALAVWTV
jgi:hypothetical protein